MLLSRLSLSLSPHLKNSITPSVIPATRNIATVTKNDGTQIDPIHEMVDQASILQVLNILSKFCFAFIICAWEQCDLSRQSISLLYNNYDTTS